MVTFSDGMRVTCDADHLWPVHTRDDRRRGKSRVVSTREIEGDLKRGRDYRYRTAQAAPVEYPERDLPVDPYVLGVWIGDATRTEDAYRVGGVGHTRDPATGRCCMYAS